MFETGDYFYILRRISSIVLSKFFSRKIFLFCKLKITYSLQKIAMTGLSKTSSIYLKKLTSLLTSLWSTMPKVRSPFFSQVTSPSPTNYIANPTLEQPKPLNRSANRCLQLLNSTSLKSSSINNHNNNNKLRISSSRLSRNIRFKWFFIFVHSNNMTLCLANFRHTHPPRSNDIFF